MDKIVVLDFGSQTSQLISRRIRETGIYCEVLPGETKAESISAAGLKGIIFSGSPESVYDPGAPLVDKKYYSMCIPILGICYGFKRIKAFRI